MILVGIDTETTGLEPEKGHKIIEICASFYNEDGKKLGTWVQRVNPNRSIDQKAYDVHKISVFDLQGEPTWEQVAPKVHRILERADVLVAHNADFDVGFIAQQLTDAGLDIPSIEVFCTMENGRWANYEGKAPKLMHLCRSVGVEYDVDKAHAAEYDVDVMMQAFFIALKEGFFKLEGVNYGRGE